MNLTGCMKNQLKIAGVSAYEMEQLELTYSALMDKELSRVTPAQQPTLAKAIQPMFFADYAQNTEAQRDAILAATEAQHPELTQPAESDTAPTAADAAAEDAPKDHGKVVHQYEKDGYLQYEDGTFDPDTERMFQQFLDNTTLDEDRADVESAIRNAIMADGDIGYLINLGWSTLRDRFWRPPGAVEGPKAKVYRRGRKYDLPRFTPWLNTVSRVFWGHHNIPPEVMEGRTKFGWALHGWALGMGSAKNNAVYTIPNGAKDDFEAVFEEWAYTHGAPVAAMVDKALQLLNPADPLYHILQKMKRAGISDINLVFMSKDDMTFTFGVPNPPPALAFQMVHQRHGLQKQAIVIQSDAFNYYVMGTSGADVHHYARIFAHELMHSFVTIKMVTEPKFHYKVTKLLHQARKAALSTEGGLAMRDYGLTDVQEFIAEAFTNTNFQQFLSSIPMEGKELSKNSIWDTLRDLIGKLIDLVRSDEYTMLDHVLRLDVFTTEGYRQRKFGNNIRGRQGFEAMRELDNLSTSTWRTQQFEALNKWITWLEQQVHNATARAANMPRHPRAPPGSIAERQVVERYMATMGRTDYLTFGDVMREIRGIAKRGGLSAGEIQGFFFDLDLDWQVTERAWDRIAEQTAATFGNDWALSKWDVRARTKELRKSLKNLPTWAQPGSFLLPSEASYQEPLVFPDTEQRQAVVEGRRNFIAEINRLITEPANKLFAARAGTPYDTKTVAYTLAQENKQSADTVLNAALATLDARDPLRTLAQGLKQTGMRGVHTLFGSADMWNDLDSTVAQGGGMLADSVKLFDQEGNYLSVAGYNLTTLDTLSDTQRPEVVFHELVHAVTLAKLRTDPAARAQVQKLLDRARRHAIKTHRLNDYGLNNVFEFVAEAFTSTSFQEFLLTVPGEQTGTSAPVRLWQDFLDFVRQTVGLSTSARDYSLLDDVIRLQSTLFMPADARLATQTRPDYAARTKEAKKEQAESREDWEHDRFGAKIHLEERIKRGFTPPAGWMMAAEDLGPDHAPRVFRHMVRPSQHDYFIPGAVTGMMRGGSGTYARDTTTNARNLARQGFLGFFTMDQLVRTYRRYFNHPGIGNPLLRYWDVVRKKVTYAREHQEVGERISRKWRELEIQHPAVSKALSKLMLDTTLSEIHPDLPIDHDKNLHLWKVKRDAKKGDSYVLKKKTTAELYANLAREYAALPPEAKAVYQEVKNYYNNQRMEMRRETLRNIIRVNGWDEKMSADQVQTLISQDNADDLLRIAKLIDPTIADELHEIGKHAIRGTSVHGPYFPLRRYGDYVVEANRNKTQDYSSKEDAEEAAKEWRHADPTNKAKVKKMNDTTFRVTFIDRIVSMHETETAAREFAATLAAQGYVGDEEDSPIKVTVKSEWRAPPDSSANVLLTQAKKKFGDQPEILKALDTAFLELLLENSMRKSDLVRHKVKGASLDMRRAFAERAYAGSWAVADVMTAFDHAEAMRGMNRAHREAESHNIEMGHLFKELQLRDQRALADRKVSTVDRFLANFGFAWILASPSYAAVNATQVPLVALPYLYAKYGKGAHAALFRSYQGVFKAGYKGLRDAKFGFGGPVETVLDEVKKELTPDEVVMVEHLTNLGIIDATFARELYATSRGEQAGAYMTTFMNVARGLPQATEIVNRVVVARTAFQLARKQGQSIASATEAASEAVLETQFDYSDTNKPRYFKAFPGARAIMMFKMYAQGMYALTLGNAVRSFDAGLSRADRKQARKLVAGIVASHTLAAGVLGGLFSEPIRALISMAAFLFEDEDEPWDLDAEVAGLLSDLFGVAAGDMMARGVPRGLGIDLSSRVGLNNLAFMDGPEARSYEEGYKQALIALLGPTAAVGGRMARGIDYIGRGEYAKGVENLAPRFLRDPVKAWRVGSRGMTDYNGNVIQPGEEFGVYNALTQSIGFTPAKAALTYEARGAQQRADIAARDARKAIIREWRQASPADKSRVFLNRVVPFNRKHPSNLITRDSLMDSVKQSGIRQARTVAGYATKDPQIREKGRFGGEL